MENEEYAIGIDLGTTYSCMAILRNGEVEIIPNEIGENTTPSIVSFSEKEIFVGEQIQNQFIKNPKKTIYSIKRLMGKNFDDIEVQNDIKSNFWTFDVVKPQIGSRPQIRIENNDGDYLYYFPEQISQLIIEKLLKSAKKYLGFPVKKAVITVPAYFNDEQRNATKLAATSAGLEILRIINEPTAASLAYGLNKKLPKNEKSNVDSFLDIFKSQNEKNKNGMENNNINNINNINDSQNNNDDDKENSELILVFDLGGGTFDVTLLKIIDQEIFNVIATSGDSHLGGDDFDKKIIDYCLKDFNKRYNIDINEIKKDLKTMNRLKIAAEKAKIILSLDEKTTIFIDEFYKKEILNVTITRKQFEDLCQDLFIKLIYPLDKVLENGNKSISEINEIVFVGGSTRIPKIKELIQDYFFDININDTINPDETVAYGAAIQAAKLMNQGDDVINDIILTDITPFSLGISVKNKSEDLEIQKKGSLMDIVIPRGTKIPYKKEKRYFNSYDYQEVVSIDVYEGEKKYVKDNHFLGTFKLENLPKKKEGEVKIDVTFSIDESGILFVNGFEPSKGIINSIKIINDKAELSQNEIIKKLSETSKTLISSIDFTKEKNYKKEMNDYYNYYNNTINRKEKFKYINNFSQATVNFLNTLSFENIDILGNKYFLYIKTLFYSYNIGLNILEMVNDDYIKEIINYSKYFIDILSSFQNINYKHYIELLKYFKIENRNNILFELVVYVMEIIQNKADMLNKNKTNFSKYNSKYLYKNCLHISNLFIKNDRDLALVDAGIRKRHIRCIEKCKSNIKMINADSFKIIKNTKKSAKLFENKDNLNREELLILLDNFRHALHNINGLNDSESEAFYYANIVKINYLYLNNDNYKQLKMNAEHCINLAKATIKNVEEKNWFKEITNILEDLNKKINEKNNNNEDFEEKIKRENKEIFEEIKKYREKSNIEFIEFILQKYPPKKSILKNNQTVKERWDNNKDSFLRLLFARYHPDHHFHKNTEEEKLKYTIYSVISIEINSILEEINPNHINLIE